MKRKFDWIIDPTIPRPQTFWDVDLFDNKNFAVVPSLGSLVPGWLLVIPRRPAISLADLPQSDKASLEHLLLEIRKQLPSREHTVYEFEHGSRYTGSVMGCGLDQAHLHIVPLQFDLLSAALNVDDSKISWSEIKDSTDPWRNIPLGDEYIFIRGNGKTLVGLVKEAVSQWVRRVIAAHLNHENKWDYKQFNGAENILRTRVMVGK